MFDPYRKWLGIPEQFRPPTHYQLLGIGADEQDREVIEAAVVRQSAYVRNFQNGPNADHATRLLNEIAAARGCLLDQVKRAAYDATIRPTTATVAPLSQATLPQGALPQGTLPPGLAVPVTPAPMRAVAPQAASSPAGPVEPLSPKAGGAPAAGSGLQPIAVRPASLADTVTPGNVDVTRVASGSAPRNRPAPVPAAPVPGSKNQVPRSQLRPATAANVSGPADSLLDQLMTAHLETPSIRRRPSSKAAPPRTALLASVGALGALLVVVALVVGLRSLFDDAAPPEIAARPAKPTVTHSAASKIPRRASAPRRQANSQLGVESLDLSLNPPATSPPSRPTPSGSASPNDGTADGAADSAAANLGIGQSNGGSPPLSNPAPIQSVIPPASTNPASPTIGQVPGQPMPFKPRLKLNEDRQFGEIRRLELPTTFCTALAFSVSGRQVAAGTSNGRVLLWSMENPQDFESLANFVESSTPVTCLTFTPDDNTLLVGTADGRIRGVSMQAPEHREIVHFTEHLKGARRMTFFNNGASVASSGDDRTVRIWTLAEGRQLSFFGGFLRSVNCLWVAEDGSRVIASDSRFVGIANSDGKKPRNFKISPPVSTLATLSHNGRYLVCPEGRGLNVRDLTNSREATPFPDDKSALMGVARFSPDDQLLATSNLSDPGITLWDFDRRKKVAVLEAHSMRLTDIAFSPDNRLMASSSLDTSLRIWRLPDLATLRENAAKKTNPAASGKLGE